MADAVKKVDGQTKGQPDDQPQPGIKRQGEHLGQADEGSGQGNPGEPGAAKGTVDAGTGPAQNEDTEADDGEGEKSSDRNEFAQDANGK